MMACNRWNLGHSTAMIKSDEPQFQRVKDTFHIKTRRAAYLEELKGDEGWACERLGRRHRPPLGAPGRPQLGLGFGMNFYETHRSPNYDREAVEIKVPNFSRVLARQQLL